MIAALAALATATAACPDGLCNPRTLDPFFHALDRARVQGGQGRRPIHILQIGDSHTAGDTITGGWRELLQARYGYGGRGVLAAGRPYQGYLTRGVTADMSPGWTISATFGAASAPPRPMMGLSGFSLTSQRPGARIGLTADAAQMFDRFVVCAVAAPGAGSLTVRVGERIERIDLGSPSRRPECRTIETAAPAGRAELIADGGPVTVTSWATFRSGGGIVLSNVGVVGSQLGHFARADDAVVAEELRTYKPDLIVVAFGTNEGFAPVFRPGEYDITLRTQIGRLRRLSGGVPILLLGAPDAGTRRPELARNAPGPTPPYCPEPAAAAASPAAPLPAQTRIGTGRLDDLLADISVPDEVVPPPPPPPRPPAAPAAWSVRAQPIFPPAGLVAVREVQHRVATSLGVALWEWDVRMGGACSAVKWVKGTPALMRGDYVHFNSAGGREIATRLNADFERAHAASAGR